MALDTEPTGADLYTDSRPSGLALDTEPTGTDLETERTGTAGDGANWHEVADIDLTGTVLHTGPTGMKLIDGANWHGYGYWANCHGSG